MPTCLVDVDPVGIQSLNDDAVVAPQRRRQSAIAAGDMNDQTALDAGGTKDLARLFAYPVRISFCCGSLRVDFRAVGLV
jgi:hypothetical protein